VSSTLTFPTMKNKPGPVSQEKMKKYKEDLMKDDVDIILRPAIIPTINIRARKEKTDQIAKDLEKNLK